MMVVIFDVDSPICVVDYNQFMGVWTKYRQEVLSHASEITQIIQIRFI